MNPLEALIAALRGKPDPATVLPDTLQGQQENELRNNAYPNDMDGGGSYGWFDNRRERFLRDEYTVPVEMAHYRTNPERLLPDTASGMARNRRDRLWAEKEREESRDRVGPRK